MATETEIKAVRNAVYRAHGVIECEVWFSDVLNADGTAKYLPYTATASDMTAHGQALYAGLIAGQYGEVAAYKVTEAMLNAAKADKYAEINGWRNRQEAGHYVFAFKGRRWDYGKATLDRLSPSVAMARQNRLPGEFAWTDADNQDVPMNGSELIAFSEAIEQAMFTKGLAIHLRQRAMKQAVSSLTTLEAIEGYRVDWPVEGEGN